VDVVPRAAMGVVPEVRIRIPGGVVKVIDDLKGGDHCEGSVLVDMVVDLVIG